MAKPGILPASNDTPSDGGGASLRVRVAVAIVVSAAILFALFRQTTAEQLGALITSARFELLALGLGVYMVLSLIRSFRFRLLFPGAGLGALFAITCVHQLLLRVMPARTGELGFGWLLRRTGAAGFTQGTVGLLLLRILDLATVLLLGALALATTRAGESVARPTVVALAVGAAAVGLGLGARLMLHAGERTVSWVARRLRLEERPFVGRALDALGRAGDWSRALPRRTLALASAVTMVQWCASFLLVWVMATAMGLAPSAADAVVAGTGTVFGATVPVPGVGTFGPLEAGWAGGFALVGVPLERAVASGLGYSIFTFGYSVITGAASWAWLSTRRPRDGGAR